MARDLYQLCDHELLFPGFSLFTNFAHEAQVPTVSRAGHDPYQPLFVIAEKRAQWRARILRLLPHDAKAMEEATISTDFDPDQAATILANALAHEGLVSDTKLELIPVILRLSREELSEFTHRLYEIIDQAVSTNI